MPHPGVADFAASPGSHTRSGPRRLREAELRAGHCLRGCCLTDGHRATLTPPTVAGDLPGRHDGSPEPSTATSPEGLFDEAGAGEALTGQVMPAQKSGEIVNAFTVCRSPSRSTPPTRPRPLSLVRADGTTRGKPTPPCGPPPPRTTPLPEHAYSAGADPGGVGRAWCGPRRRAPTTDAGASTRRRLSPRPSTCGGARFHRCRRLIR